MRQLTPAAVLDVPRPSGSKVKICGAKHRWEVAEVAQAGADMIGLWFAMPGAAHSLDRPQLTDLSHYAQTWDLSPVLVTLSQSVADMISAVEDTRAHSLQLHAFQRPSVVRGLKERRPELHILKVLHVADGVCMESRFLQRYVDAGVDCFLVDSMASGGQVGSTGEPVPPAVVEELLDVVPVPVMLAGGLNSDNVAGYSTIRGHEHFFGADFDSAARCSEGKLNGQRVAALVESWGPEVNGSLVPAS